MTEKTAQKEPGKKPVPSKKPKPQQEVVVQISLSELHPFPDHPFQVREDFAVYAACWCSACLLGRTALDRISLAGACSCSA